MLCKAIRPKITYASLFLFPNLEVHRLCLHDFPVAQRYGIPVNAWTRVAGGDGEPGVEVAGVEHGELLNEGDDHDAPVHGDVGDFRVELDVVHLGKRDESVYNAAGFPFLISYGPRCAVCRVG